jgi:beta-lactam-binding protein with PASTA domain/tRNA A-37 threonylcarbamoyl transferase component Bud32
VSTPPSDSLVGHVIDRRYFVEDKIARGGMATVYRALDYRLERPVAIKVMHPHLAADEAFTKRFIQEARQSARLAHPNIVNVFDQGQDGEYTYIVMEYLPGITLRQLLKDFSTLTWEQTLDVVKAVLNGLDAAHTAGIVHRDVKPENVLLADDGRIKIADFGLARAASHNTQTGQALLGTVAYLSPELVTGSPADVRSDIYGLGIMMYEMLTGEQPFTGDEAVAIAYQHANGTVPAPSEKNSTVPHELDDIVRWCTERDPADRPSHARALLEKVVTVERGIRRRLASEPTTRVMPPAAPVDPTRTRVMTPAQESLDDQVTEVLHPAEQVFADLDMPDYAEATPVSAAAKKTATTTDDRDKSKKPWALIITGIVVAVAAFVGGALLWLAQQPDDPELIAIDDVRGLEVPVATAQLITQGFIVSSTIAEEYDEDIPEGLVVGTDPEAGVEVEVGSEIGLVVSLGPSPVGMPAIIGLNLDRATTLLEERGFVVGEIDLEFSRVQPKDQVLEATDEAGIPVGPGTELAVGTVINLLVSAGEIPDVTGQTLDQARATLDAVGLTGLPTGDGAFSDTVPLGSVISMDIPAGQVVKPGDTIALTISRGPALVAIPRVLDLDVATAREILEDLGFVVRPIIEPPDETIETERDPRVYRVSPAEGQQVPRGSEVTLSGRYLRAPGSGG